MTAREPWFSYLRRWWILHFGSVLSNKPIPAADIRRAGELAKKRGWKNIDA